MYPLSRWWLDFGLSRWEASKCNSECLGLHSWCVTYNVCLQTTLIFEMVRVSQRVPRALFQRAHMYRELMLKALAMPRRLSLWRAGAGADSEWLGWARWCGLIQPIAKGRLDKFDADILPSLPLNSAIFLSSFASSSVSRSLGSVGSIFFQH